MSTESDGADRPGGITPSQTVGPFFAYALTPRAYGGRELASELLAPEGVPGERIVPVVNRAPRNPRLRAEAGMTFARLLTATNPGVMLASSPLYLPERRRVAELLRDNAGPPTQLVRPLAGAVRALLEAAPPGAGRTAGTSSGSSSRMGSTPRRSWGGRRRPA